MPTLQTPSSPFCDFEKLQKSRVVRAIRATVTRTAVAAVEGVALAKIEASTKSEDPSQLVTSIFERLYPNVAESWMEKR